MFLQRLMVRMDNRMEMDGWRTKIEKQVALIVLLNVFTFLI